MMKRLFFLLFIIILFSGCASKVLVDGEPVSVSDEVLCVKDSDCACGVHIDTGECFYGNKDFVDVSRQCPDFCTGIAAMFETRCVEKVCTQVRIR